MNMSFIFNTNFQQGKVKTITFKTLIRFFGGYMYMYVILEFVTTF